MGAFKGGLTIKRFRVDGDPPDDFRESYVKALRAQCFRPLKPEDDADRATGWTVCGRLLDTDFHVAKAYWNEYLVATFRVDSLRIPPTMLEAHAQVRMEEILAERGEDAPGLSRHEREDVKEWVRRDLRRKMLPSMKGVDVVWNFDTRRVLVWTHNASLLEEIEDLFLRTFGKVLLPEDPYSAAEYAGWGEADGAPLQHVEPADFTGTFA